MILLIVIINSVLGDTTNELMLTINEVELMKEQVDDMEQTQEEEPVDKISLGSTRIILEFDTRVLIDLKVKLYDVVILIIGFKADTDAVVIEDGLKVYDNVKVSIG
jgi:hypothetical protein